MIKSIWYWHIFLLIETPITDYGTLLEVFIKSEEMAKESNTTYTHITMDCGATMKAYHVIWNNPERFSKIILHLGDFHFMQAFFGVVGSYVQGSGFEDIVYQLGLCQAGSHESSFEGEALHKSFSEVIFQLLLDRFLKDEDKERIFAIDSPDEIEDSDVKLISNVIQQGLDGEFGVTPGHGLYRCFAWIMFSTAKERL